MSEPARLHPIAPADEYHSMLMGLIVQLTCTIA